MKITIQKKSTTTSALRRNILFKPKNKKKNISDFKQHIFCNILTHHTNLRFQILFKKTKKNETIYFCLWLKVVLFKRLPVVVNVQTIEKKPQDQQAYQTLHKNIFRKKKS